MSGDEPLFEGAVRENGATDDSSNSSGFEPISIDDSDLDFDHNDWNKDAPPISWLSKKDSRFQFSIYALEQVLDGDPVYLNKSQLAEKVGMSRHSAQRHIEDLVDLGVYEVRDDGVRRYRPNRNSQVLAAMATLNEAIADHSSAL